MPPGFATGLAIGASVSVDGVCLTVTALHGATQADFDVMQQSLDLTTLGAMASRQPRQRGARGQGRCRDRRPPAVGSCRLHRPASPSVRGPDNNRVLRLAVPAPWMRYVFAKGYIAVNGASLTVAEAQREPAARAGSRSG